MGKNNYYGVYDGDELILEGGSKAITERFGIAGSDIYQYTNRGYKLFGKYKVVKLGKIETIKEKNEAPKLSRKQQILNERFDYISRCLKIYGNVYSTTDGSDLKEMLNGVGIYFDSRQFGKGDYILTRTR